MSMPGPPGSTSSAVANRAMRLFVTLAPVVKHVLPGPAPSEIDQVIPNRSFYEIPIGMQDRAFNADGSLFYPDSP